MPQPGLSPARIQQREINELNESSEALAAVAEMIKRANPTWKDGAIALLIQANDRIVRIQQKGARAYQHFYERQNAIAAAHAPVEGAPAAADEQVPRADQGEV